jgi:hypothetical protein
MLEYKSRTKLFIKYIKRKQGSAGSSQRLHQPLQDNNPKRLRHHKRTPQYRKPKDHNKYPGCPRQSGRAGIYKQAYRKLRKEL